MSNQFLIRCYPRLPSVDSVLVQGKTDVDYDSVVDQQLAQANGPPLDFDRSIIIRALMNLMSYRVADGLHSLYRNGKLQDDLQPFEAAYKNYLTFILNPIYIDVAPEVAINTVLHIFSMSRTYLNKVDKRTDLLISRLNVGGMFKAKAAT